MGKLGCFLTVLNIFIEPNSQFHCRLTTIPFLYSYISLLYPFMEIFIKGKVIVPNVRSSTSYKLGCFKNTQNICHCTSSQIYRTTAVLSPSHQFASNCKDISLIHLNNVICGIVCDIST